MTNSNARMVDVTAKGETVREAVAKGRIRVSEECFGKIKEGTMAKGDVLGVARIAGSWEQSVLQSLFRCATS